MGARIISPRGAFCAYMPVPNAESMKIVLAYSGGLDTSVILKWLRESYDAEIITFAADIGQEEELKGLSRKSRGTGASRHYTLDLVEEFARDFIYPMLRANAVYEGQYRLGTSIARPLIAKAQVEVAKREKAEAVAHGATGKGNDQCRFELTYMALAPRLRIISPWKIDAFREKFPGRAEMIAYCRKHRIPVEASLRKPTRWTGPSSTSHTRPASSRTRGSTRPRGPTRGCSSFPSPRRTRPTGPSASSSNSRGATASR